MKVANDSKQQRLMTSYDSKKLFQLSQIKNMVSINQISISVYMIIYK